MTRKIARGCVICGAILLLAAAALVVYNLVEDHRSGASAQEVLSAIRQEILSAPVQESTVPEVELPPSDLFAEYEQTDAPTQKAEPIVEWDGRAYIGILSIPALDLELPVLAEHTADNLKVAPCRYSGTAADGTLVLAAHNYRSHFGTLSSLASDDRIVFTDAEGTEYSYTVLQSETVDGYDVAGMTNGAGENWALTLFTCTLGGKSRVTVRAVME